MGRPLSVPRAPRVAAMARQSHWCWPSCQAPSLAVSWHPRDPHCPGWVSPKQGDTATMPGPGSQLRCHTQETQAETGQRASSGLACCLTLRLITLIRANWCAWSVWSLPITRSIATPLPTAGLWGRAHVLGTLGTPGSRRGAGAGQGGFASLGLLLRMEM